MKSSLSLVALSLAAATSFGCGPAAERIEANRVQAAIKRLRNAPAGEGRRTLVDDLAAMPVEFDLARTARDDCAAAYRLMLDGEMLERRAKEGVAPGSPTPAAQAIADLRAASAKLADATTAMNRCSVATVTLTKVSTR